MKTISQESRKAGKNRKCSFGILSDDARCERPAVWQETRRGEPTRTAWCDDHKPTWRLRAGHELIQIGPSRFELRINSRGDGFTNAPIRQLIPKNLGELV